MASSPAALSHDLKLLDALATVQAQRSTSPLGLLSPEAVRDRLTALCVEQALTASPEDIEQAVAMLVTPKSPESLSNLDSLPAATPAAPSSLPSSVNPAAIEGKSQGIPWQRPPTVEAWERLQTELKQAIQAKKWFTWGSRSGMVLGGLLGGIFWHCMSPTTHWGWIVSLMGLCSLAMELGARHLRPKLGVWKAGRALAEPWCTLPQEEISPERALFLLQRSACRASNLIDWLGVPGNPNLLLRIQREPVPLLILDSSQLTHRLRESRKWLNEDKDAWSRLLATVPTELADSAWSYHRRPDLLTDRVQIVARLNSRNTKEATHLVLEVIQDQGHPETARVSFNLKWGAWERAKCVRLRWDEDPVSTWKVDHEKEQSLWLENGEEFVSQLKKAKRLVIEAPFYTTRHVEKEKKVIVFDVVHFDLMALAGSHVFPEEPYKEECRNNDDDYD
jgi:hypothetical protein